MLQLTVGMMGKRERLFQLRHIPLPTKKGNQGPVTEPYRIPSSLCVWRERRQMGCASM